MRYRKQDQDGDHVFGSSANDFYVDSAEAVAQSVKTRLNLWIGEWFADTSDGTGWNQAILGKKAGNLYELALRQRVLETQGVLSIEDFESQTDPKIRKLTVTMTINTIYGTYSLDEEINR